MNEVSHLFLQLDGAWHQIVLDYGLIFWREGIEPELNATEARTCLIDETAQLGIERARVREVRTDDLGAGRGMKANLTISFDNGQGIVLRCVNGSMTFLVSP